jgi:hypothetical protein
MPLKFFKTPMRAKKPVDLTINDFSTLIHPHEQYNSPVPSFQNFPGLMLSLFLYKYSKYATGYGLDGPGIEPRWGRDFFAHVQTGPGAHPASWTMDTGSFPGVKQPGRGAEHPTPFSAEVTNEWSYTSTPSLGLRGLL